jgi:hypothetical protein
MSWKMCSTCIFEHQLYVQAKELRSRSNGKFGHFYVLLELASDFGHLSATIPRCAQDATDVADGNYLGCYELARWEYLYVSSHRSNSDRVTAHNTLRERQNYLGVLHEHGTLRLFPLSTIVVLALQPFKSRDKPDLEVQDGNLVSVA